MSRYTRYNDNYFVIQGNRPPRVEWGPFLLPAGLCRVPQDDRGDPVRAGGDQLGEHGEGLLQTWTAG